MTDTLVLRFADVGVATYASLRRVGDPGDTVTWVVDQADLLEAVDRLRRALPDPVGEETRRDALERALTHGALSAPATETGLAQALGERLIAPQGWRLIAEAATVFVSPSARLAQVPWGLLAAPGGERLMELADVLLAAPPNIVNAPRATANWSSRHDRPALLVLDPRVPGQRPDAALGSVLGRPSPETALARHYAGRPVLPEVPAAVDLFRRTDIDRRWLAEHLARQPSRLLYVGHASAADGDVGHADRAALHLAEDRPLTAADLMASRLPFPPRVALLACASGGDYQFDEASGLVAAAILGGAQLVTATLWSLPTAAGYRQYTALEADPMSEAILAVDEAHETDEAGRALNAWQRRRMRDWRDGDATASPLYWAALVTFAVDGAR
ncbi:CHAT domain-containing protein [Mycolicibacterium flavescens]|uniref:CHAT domain-containing protein n=1 Tax=Mycolicibacterium flavescens TaxID=1776 RepID=A0A1E3RQJ1_MYCFV|nr:CHAT domain-containing protein [Mycolicibacterium flavescens]MCV7279335.1 CHAT domain-containing protein [Mycolicibacterium flavescens]ODQ92120.1 CHAT domain-containing protein [Mycolicibacterium flavescens]